jgi:hypothetical protein
MAHQLASWNDTPTGAAIVDFVARVSNEGGPDDVPPSERIATFDNDGTLWCEKAAAAAGWTVASITDDWGAVFA